MSNVIGDASGIAAASVPAEHASPASAFKRLAAGSIPRPPSQPLYLASLWVVTVLCALMPLLYLGLIGGIAWLEYMYYTSWVPLEGRMSVLRLIAWVLPGFVGAVVMLFLLKPLLAPRRKPPQSLRLVPGDEPDITLVVQGLCAAIGIRPPVAIEISHEANAWVHFERGLAGMLRGRKVLTIGLPLVAGMNVRQFVGVLAHEFGHFAQGGGMRSAFIINHVNRWLHSRGYQRDEWDARIDDWDDVGLPVIVAQLSLEVTRALMRMLFQISFRSSRRLSQEMEFDADRYEATVAGSACFGETALRLRAIALALHQAGTGNRAAWNEGKLVADLPAAAVARMGQWEASDWEHVALELQGDHETHFWDSHPADQARIANAEALRAPGLVLDERPATLLFGDFPALSRRVTTHYYRERGLEFGPRNLIEVEQLLGLNRLDGNLAAAWKRYSNDMLGDIPLLSPREADLLPVSKLDWQATVDELRRLAPDASGLWKRIARLRERGAAAMVWVTLIDLGMDFEMPDGTEPDAVRLRTEHAAGAARDTPDHRLADRILALFARRLQHALRASTGDESTAMASRLELLQTLHDRAPRLLALAETRQSLLRLHSGTPAENHELRKWTQERAIQYRVDTQQLLELLDGTVLATGESLGKALRNRCGHLSTAGDDPLRFLRVTAPLEDAFLHLYRTTLAQLAEVADRAESDAGIRPIRLVNFAPRPALA